MSFGLSLDRHARLRSLAMTFSGVIASAAKQCGSKLLQPATIGWARPHNAKGMRLPMVRMAASTYLLFGSASQALAAGVTFELAQVLESLKREIAAADTSADAGRPPVRIEEAQVDLDLVEIPGKAGARLVVPGSDFASGKEDTPKPPLKRRIVVELTPVRDEKPAEPVAAGNSSGRTTGIGAGSGLARAIAELKTAVRAGAEASPPYELKRVGIDLEFALERTAKGAPATIVFAAGRRIEPQNVQKLRLKLSTREK
jgi:hypothetical protein